MQNLFKYICLFFILPFAASAETAYIIDQIQVGLHSKSNLDSPILKLVGTGTPLEVKQRGVDMSQVEDPAGTIGWINTAYLVDKKPANASTNNQQELTSLQSELDQARNQIKQLKTDLSNVNNIKEAEELTSLRLKIGELQAKLTEERKLNSNISTTDSNDAILQVEARNAELQKTISQLQGKLSRETPSNSSISFGEKPRLIYLLFPLIVGMVLGIFLYDLYKRHQHGGFRV